MQVHGTGARGEKKGLGREVRGLGLFIIFNTHLFPFTSLRFVYVSVYVSRVYGFTLRYGVL